MIAWLPETMPRMEISLKVWLKLLRRFFVVGFSGIVPKIFKKDTSVDEIMRILVLKEKLIQVGYNPDEVNYMIKTFSKDIDIVQLNSKQLKKVEDQLTDQLSIAKQSIHYMRSPK
jgi:hypothetical protein